METYGDLKKAIKSIQFKQKGAKVGKATVDWIVGVIPGLSIAKSTFDVLKAALRKPDTKKSNSWLDKLDIDDEVEAIVDDTVENGFLKNLAQIFDSEPDDKPLEQDFNMNQKMVDYLKGEYEGRTVTGIQEQKSVFDKFFTKFAYKFDKGYPDMNNAQDVLLLETLLSEVLGEEVKVKEANLSGRTTNYSKPTGAFYKYVELNDSSDTMGFETERDAPIFDTDSFEVVANIDKGENFKILDSKESDLTKKGNSYYTRIDYKGKEYYIRLSDILKPSGKQVDFIDVDLDSKTKDNVFNNFKAGHGQEIDIVKLWIEKSGKNYEFNYQGKTYEIERVGAPSFTGKGNPKTDIFVSLDKPISPYGNDLKISLKAANATFVENWMLPSRFEQILGLEDGKRIIVEFLQKLQKEEIGTRSPYMFWFIKTKPYNSPYELTREQEYEAYSGANKFGPDSEATANCYFKGNVPSTIDDFISGLKPISELNADIGLHLRGYAKGGNAACYLLQENGEWEINPTWKNVFKIK